MPRHPPAALPYCRRRRRRPSRPTPAGGRPQPSAKAHTAPHQPPRLLLLRRRRSTRPARRPGTRSPRCQPRSADGAAARRPHATPAAERSTRQKNAMNARHFAAASRRARTSRGCSAGGASASPSVSESEAAVGVRGRSSEAARRCACCACCCALGEASSPGCSSEDGALGRRAGGTWRVLRSRGAVSALRSPEAAAEAAPRLAERATTHRRCGCVGCRLPARSRRQLRRRARRPELTQANHLSHGHADAEEAELKRAVHRLHAGVHLRARAGRVRRSERRETREEPRSAEGFSPGLRCRC